MVCSVMVFTVTARHSGNSAQVVGTTLTTDSVAETANALLILGSAAQNDLHLAAQTVQTPVGGGLSYTQVAQSAQVAFDGSQNFGMRGNVWRATIGGAPSAHTITVDHYPGTDEGFYCVVACDITGHDTTPPIVQSAANGSSLATGSAHQGTVTLASALTIGNIVIVFFSAGADSGGGFAAPTIGGQAMTLLFNQNNSWTQACLFYREITGTESNSVITTTDLGESVGQYTAIAVEIAASAGADLELNVPFFQNSPQLFSPSVTNQDNQNLDVPHFGNINQLFLITVQNQPNQDLDVPFHQNIAVLFTPLVFNEGEDVFEPILAGNGTLADRIFEGLISQGFLTGTIVDREYARLLAKLALTAPQPLSLDDLYSRAGEDNRILGIGIDVLTPA